MTQQDSPGQLGSLVAGLISGAITWRASTVTRLRWSALALAGTLAPLALVPSIPVMGAVLLAGGFAMSPTLIAAVTLAEQVLPPARLTEGMAFLLQTGIAVGLAPGAAVAGAVIDAHGASPAYLVCFSGGLLTVAGALLTRVPPVRHGAPRRRPHWKRAAPPPPLRHPQDHHRKGCEQ